MSASETPTEKQKQRPRLSIAAILFALVAGFLVGRGVLPRAPSNETRPVATAPARPAPAAAARPAPPPPPPASAKVTLRADHPRKGPAHPKVTIVEISDFQCPYCSAAAPALKQITEAYPQDVALVFVNFPLRRIHPHAADAAKAFMAAHRQGKAWPMHDKLFANQQALTPPDLEKYARELGLDLRRFQRDLGDPALDKQVRDDEALALEWGAQGTPWFFVNGRQPSARDFASWKQVVDKEIERADALLAKGVRQSELYDKLIEEASKPIAIDLAGSPTRGPAGAPVTIVAFSDFQCPFCARAAPGLEQVEEAYRGRVRIAFKNLLIPGHQNAPLAAEAALAAADQGKFWPYHDKLFANQQALDRPSLERYAQELGLDLPRFKAALDTSKHQGQIEQDARLAMALGVNSTPTFFVNGRKSVGARPLDEWKAVVDQELQRTH